MSILPTLPGLLSKLRSHHLNGLARLLAQDQFCPDWAMLIRDFSTVSHLQAGGVLRPAYCIGNVPVLCASQMALPTLPKQPWCMVSLASMYAAEEQATAYDRLRSCNSLEELQSIIYEFGPYMHISEVVSTFTTLKRFDTPAPQDFIKRLIDQALEQAPMARPKHVAAIFHACAKLSYVDFRLFEALAQQAFLPFQIEAFNHGQVATTIYSLGTLQKLVQERGPGWEGHRQGEDWPRGPGEPVVKPGDPARRPETRPEGRLFSRQDDLVALLTGRFLTISEYDEVNAWHVSNMVYGLSHLRFRNEGLLTQLGKLIVASSLRDGYTSQGLATIVTGYGQFRFRDDRVLDTLMEDAIRPARIGDFTEQALSGMLHALVVVGYRNDELVLPFLNEMMKEHRLGRYSPWELSNLWEAMAELGVSEGSMLEALAREMSKPERMVGLSKVSFHTVLSSMVKLGYRHEAFLREFTLEAIKPQRLSDMSIRDIIGYMAAIGELGVQDHTGLHALVAKVITHIDTLDERALASLVYALGQCKFKDKESIKVVLDAIGQEGRLAQFSEFSLSCLCFGLARLDVQDKQTVDAVVEAVADPKRLPHFTDHGLAGVIYGLGKLNVRDKAKRFQVLQEGLRPERLPRYTERGLASVLYGMSDVGEIGEDEVRCVVDEVMKPERLERYSEIGLSSIIFSLGELRYTDMGVFQQLMKEVIKPEHLGKFSEHGLGGIVYGLGQARFADPFYIKILLIEVAAPQRLRLFNTHGLASVVWGMGSMGIVDDFALERIVAEITRPGRLCQFSSHEASRILYGLGNLGYRSPQVDAIVNEWMQPQMVARLSNQDLSMVVHGMMQLGQREPGLVDMLATEVMLPGRLDGVSERGLVNLIQGFGRMLPGRHPDLGQLLLERVARAEHLPNFMAFMLGGIIYALGQVGIRNPSTLEPLIMELSKHERLRALNPHGFTNILFGLGQMKPPSKKILRRLVRTVALPHNVGSFSAHGLAGNLFSLGNLGMASDSVVGPLHAELLRPGRLDGCTEPDITMLLYAFTQNRPKNMEVINAVVAAAVSKGRLELFHEKGLAGIMYAIANLNVREPSLLEPVLSEIRSRVSSFSDQNLQNVIHSVGHLRSPNRLLFDDFAAELLTRRDLGAFTPMGLANAVRAMGRVGYSNVALIEALMDEVMRRGADWEEGPMTSILFGMAQLHHRDQRFLSLVDQALAEPGRLESFTEKSLLNVVHSYHRLGHGGPATVAMLTKELTKKHRMAALSNAQLAGAMNHLGKIMLRSRERAP
eukprot:evm.model.scf_34EXC.3 EVM.evm.TU.scf_34EXC.3   scf_34EXC:32107-44346(+)